MTLPDTNHAVWSLLRQVVVLVALGLVLTLNYNHFDPERDPVSMLIVFLVGGGLELLPRMIPKGEVK